MKVIETFTGRLGKYDLRENEKGNYVVGPDTALHGFLPVFSFYTESEKVKALKFFKDLGKAHGA